MSVRFVADSINLLEMLFAVVLSGLLSVVLYAIGQKKGRQAERKAIERERQTHKDQTEEILGTLGYSREQIESPVVQDAIQVSASTVISMPEGPLSVVGSIHPPTVFTGASGKVPGITKENDEQKEEDKED